MTAPTVALCTFTFNDANLADALVEHVRSWTAQPGEILITDDGSDPPYQPADLPENARILRLPRNLGITKAKHAGVSSAKTDLIVSMDCDVRVVPDWLELCLPHALRPEVGAVCGPVFHAGSDDSVARFLRAFGDNHNIAASGPVDFIPGNAYLIRRAVWEQVGGFGDYSRNVCEDHFLSTKIKSAGLALYCEPRAKVAQVRKLSRAAMIKRFWKWCHKPVKGALPEPDGFADYLMLAFVSPMVERLGTAADLGEPLFVYFELLYLSHITLDLLEFGEKAKGYGPGFKQAFAALLARLAGARPKLAALLAADLAGLGHEVSLAPFAREVNPFQETFAIFESLAATGVYDWLEREGVSLLLAEDDAHDLDFSFYRHAAHDAGETP
jgi:glycosyltransferase involved in cell wall biosynthesis